MNLILKYIFFIYLNELVKGELVCWDNFFLINYLEREREELCCNDVKLYLRIDYMVLKFLGLYLNVIL